MMEIDKKSLIAIVGVVSFVFFTAGFYFRDSIEVPIEQIADNIEYILLKEDYPIQSHSWLSHLD